MINACRHLERRGFEISYVSPDAQGKIDPALIADALRNDTILISIMHASHETGVVQPVEEIGALARERGVLFHCNAAQSAGKIPVNTPVSYTNLRAHETVLELVCRLLLDKNNTYT